MPRRLLVIGGAEDKVRRLTVLRRFVRLAGGRDARLVIIPTASGFSHEVTEVYSTVFSRLHATVLGAVHPETRAEADRPDAGDLLEQATGVFVSGGNQLKLGQLLVGTRTGQALVDAYQRGAVVAGTSAGASILSQFMISMGEEGLAPRQRASQLTLGLGLVEGVVIDQHFEQRTRYGRLLATVATSPSLLGLGIDEDTAAEVEDERTMTVVGSGSVFVVDARGAVTDAHEARRDAPLMVSGAVVHTLPAGSTFDLVQRRLTAFDERHPEDAVPPADTGERRDIDQRSVDDVVALPGVSVAPGGTSAPPPR